MTFAPALVTVVQKPPPTTVKGVVERLAEIQDVLGWGSPLPLASFNLLYHTITVEVLKALNQPVPGPSPGFDQAAAESHELFGLLDESVARMASEPYRIPTLEEVQGIRGDVGRSERIDGLRQLRISRPASPEQSARSDVDLEPAVEVAPEDVERLIAERPTNEDGTDPNLSVMASRLADGFKDPDFMEILDVKFAELYLDALASWSRGEPVAWAWAVLFEIWDNAGEGPMSGALLGIHAHINHDLAIAVTRSHKSDGAAIKDGSDRHDDYLLINDIFEVQLPILYDKLTSSVMWAKFWLYLAASATGLIDESGIFLIVETRDRAWEHAKVLEADLTNGTDPIDASTDTWTGLAAETILILWF